MTGSGVHQGDGKLASHPLSCPQDVNGDGSVNIVDIQLVASHWNTTLGNPSYNSVYDVAVPLDSRVDIRDVQAVSAAFGQNCVLAVQHYWLGNESQSPAGPQAGTISTGSGLQVWNGHNCPVNVPVNIAGLSAGLGGYETKVGWDPVRFSSAEVNITINFSTFLTNGGTRQSSGSSGTPALKAVGSGAMKYGDYSWGMGNLPGNSANGQLSTVSIKPTATYGSAALTMAETQLVDINGNLIPLTAQTGSSVAVFSRYNTSGSGVLINSRDVNAVVARLNQAVGAPCRDNYRYDASVGGAFIDNVDVNAVVVKLNQSVTTACAD